MALAAVVGSSSIPTQANSLYPLPYEIHEAILGKLASVPKLAHHLWQTRRVSREFDAISVRLLKRTVRTLLERRRGAALSSLLLNLDSRGVSWFRLGILVRQATDRNFDLDRQKNEGPTLLPTASDHLITPFMVTLSSHISSLDRPLSSLAPFLDAIKLPRFDLCYFIEEAPVADDDRIPPLGNLLWSTRYLTDTAKRWIAYNGLEDEGGWWDPAARFRLLIHSLGIEYDSDRVASELLTIAQHGSTVIASCSRFDAWTPPPAPSSHHFSVFRSERSYIEAAFPGLEALGEIISSPKFPVNLIIPTLSRLYSLIAAPDPVRSTQNRRALFRACGMRPVGDEWGSELTAEILWEISKGDGKSLSQIVAGLPFDDWGAPDAPPSEAVPCGSS
jgi:hypothetical protein